MGNGGVSVVCRNSANRVERAYLLDLYEAEKDPTLGLTIPRPPARNYHDELKRVNPRIREANWKLWRDFEHFLPQILSKLKPLQDPAVGIPLPDDFRPRVKPMEKGCGFEAVAKYMSNGEIQLDTRIFDKMSLTDQAALLAHEALYLADRENSEEGYSDDTRLFVGHLFSTLPPRSASELARNLLEPNEARNRLLLREGQRIIVRRHIPVPSRTSDPNWINMLTFAVKGAEIPWRGGRPNALYTLIAGDWALGTYVEGALSSVFKLTLPTPGRFEVRLRKEYCSLPNQGVEISFGTDNTFTSVEIDFSDRKDFSFTVDVR